MCGIAKDTGAVVLICERLPATSVRTPPAACLYDCLAADAPVCFYDCLAADV